MILQIYRWDSSDPERAPPPLPINPGTTSPATKSHVSPKVQAVAASFAEKSRENVASPYTTNPMPAKPVSPEKSLIKGHYHKRMQSLQNADTRSEFLNYLENRSPEKSLRASVLDPGSKNQDKPSKKLDDSPTENQDTDREVPNFLINSRFLSKPILNEPTPQSATMLALQNMQLPSENESFSRNKDTSDPFISSNDTHTPGPGLESLSTQIHSLTDIASNLQREMAQLSRRSKDNATDLVSLKAATNTRDEDIRKSLRELSSSLTSKFLDEEATRWDFSNLLGSESRINHREPDSSPSSKKSHSMPRMPSPNPLTASMEREVCGSPGPISDGSASIALLEKVLREMATKDGQEALLEAVEEIKARPVSDGHDKDAERTMNHMLEEILQLVREDPGSKALVRSRSLPGPNTHDDRARSRSLDPEQVLAPDMEFIHGERRPMIEQRPEGRITDEMLDIMKRVKTSVIEGGGITNEVKALVRELRGEVLGMGRNMARKFEEDESARSAEAGKPQPLGKEEVASIVEASLTDLKELLASTVNESRQNSSAFSELRSSMNSAEIYSIVKQALDELEIPQPPAEPQGVGMQNEEILETVRQGWETYKPEIELQNFGLERDEILECLSEGLKAYQPRHDQAVTYDQVLAAVQAGMQSFEQRPTITKDEIIQTIRECIANSEPTSSRSLGDEHMGAIRDEVLQAVTESVSSQSVLTRDSLDSGLGRDEILSAVSDGIETHFTAAKGAEKPHVTKEDVANSINDAFAAQHSALSTNTQPTVSRDEILGAIAEGLENQNSMTREIELNKDDLMDAISAALHEATAAANTGIGDQVLAQFHGVLEKMKEEFKQYSEANRGGNDHVLDTVKDGIDVVRKEIEGYAANAAEASGSHEVMDTVKEGFRLLQADMEKTISEAAFANSPRGNPDTPELLDAMEKEFEHLRQTLTSLLIRTNVSSEKEEIIDAINDVTENQKSQPKKQDMVNTIKEELQSHHKQDDLLTAIREEFGNLRESMNMSLARAEPASDKDEIIAALNQSLEAFHEDTARSKDSGESSSFYSGQLLDAFNDGVGTIRTDIARVLDKPAEFDASELLGTLKEGLGSLKADVEALRNSQTDSQESRGRELTVASDTSTGDRGLDPQDLGPQGSESRGFDNGVEELKTMIAQLQGKVESIETSPRAPEPAQDALRKEHLDDVVTGLHELQNSVASIVARENPPDETVAKKEDTDAIETLLRNTKAQLDDLAFPAADQVAKAEQFGGLETVVKETKDAITDLSGRLEAEGPTKSEIGTLESLLKDMWIAFDEFKGKGGSNEDEAEKLVKSDLQTVEAMIFEVKTQIDELKLPDVETLPTKNDIQELSTLVTEFREKSQAENESAVQVYDARKTENAGISEKLDEAKSVVEGLGDELKSKLDGSHEGLSELKQVLEGLALSAESFTTVDNVKELTELINREFERFHGDQDASKVEKEEQDATAIVKHDESRAAIIVELGAKIDEKVGEVMAKYDEAQTAMDSKFDATEERDNANLEAVTSTKALAEDVKLVIGAMGNSVNETCERISVDTKTFFEKVDESYGKMETMQNDVKTTQEQARADFEKTAAATDRVESQLHQFHPQVLESIQEILSVVGQHYDHSQKSAEDVRTGLSSLPSTILPALPTTEPEKYDDSKVQEKLDNLLNHTENTQVQDALNILVERVTNDQVHDKLDQLLSETTSTNGQVYDKLNELLSHVTNTNGPVHDKLDTLIGHATNTDQSVTQMMKLDEMHKDIMETSRRMNEMFATQSALVAEDNERKRREAEEAAMALERRTAQKEQVESEIVGLREEKDSLLKIIHTLQSEKEDLTKQNTKVSKELSGVEMALELRHDEMQVMEDRADSLEKRILEGVLDHARSVLLSRPKGVPGMNSKRARGSRARGPSVTSNASTAKDARGILGNGVGMALKKRPSVSSQTGSAAPSNAGKERRIFSLSHVTGNRGAGDRQVSAGSGITNLKRSHSVKSNISQRKASWGGKSSVANKENDMFPEEDEHPSGDESDTGTERRTSYAGTYTDSMLSGDRRVSGASKGHESNESEPDDGDDDDAQTTKGEDDPTGDLPAETDMIDPETKKLVLFGHQATNDSGLGTELSSGAE